MPSTLMKFTKQQRLLNSKQYQPVFNGTEIKVVSKYFLLLAKQNNQQKQSRLGIIVAKKHAKLAVVRNFIKRSIRESFRIRTKQQQSFDIVVLLKRHQNKQQMVHINSDLMVLWARFDKSLERLGNKHHERK